MSFSQALIFWLMVALEVKFFYDLEKSRAKPVSPRVDGYEPVNREIVDLAARQL